MDYPLGKKLNTYFDFHVTNLKCVFLNCDIVLVLWCVCVCVYVCVHVCVFAATRNRVGGSQCWNNLTPSSPNFLQLVGEQYAPIDRWAGARARARARTSGKPVDTS